MQFGTFPAYNARMDEKQTVILISTQWTFGAIGIAAFAYAVWAYLRIATDIPNVGFNAAMANPVSMSEKGRAYRNKLSAAILVLALASVLGGMIEGCLKSPASASASAICFGPWNGEG